MLVEMPHAGSTSGGGGGRGVRGGGGMARVMPDVEPGRLDMEKPPEACTQEVEVTGSPR